MEKTFSSISYALVGLIFSFWLSGCTMVQHKHTDHMAKPVPTDNSSNKSEKKEESPKVSEKENKKKQDTAKEEIKLPIDTSKTREIKVAKSEPIKLTPRIKLYCQKINRKFKKYGWGDSECESYRWNRVRNSVLGKPLMWTVFGDEAAHRQANMSATLVLCGVHGDEITPIKFCFDIIEELKKNSSSYQNSLVVVAPIVNPDSFFRNRPSRTNHRGVDVNRNFPTQDWSRSALKMWRTKFGRDKRRYPGKRALSEPETLFQVNLIKRYRPDKIISVHAPLTMLDYDGPEDDQKVKASEHAKDANQLLITMSRKALGYRVKNYPYFPGSLGNWAGKERNIPTYTLELPSSDNRKSKKYWLLFKDAIKQAFKHDLRKKKYAHAD